MNGWSSFDHTVNTSSKEMDDFEFCKQYVKDVADLYISSLR